MIDRKNIVHYIVFDWIAAMIVWLLFYAFRRVVNDMALFGDMPIFTPSFNFVRLRHRLNRSKNQRVGTTLNGIDGKR